jgi:hypothetical protein
VAADVHGDADLAVAHADVVGRLDRIIQMRPLDGEPSASSSIFSAVIQSS